MARVPEISAESCLEQILKRLGGLLWDDAIAEEMELGSAGEAFAFRDPAGRKAHHPFDEIG
nr:hypothetical protein [Streptomyces sp. MZ04]